MAACSESFLGIETSGLIYCEDEPISFTDLLDRSTGKVMVFTLFETEADMQARMSSGLVQQQLAKLALFRAIHTQLNSQAERTSCNHKELGSITPPSSLSPTVEDL